MREFLPVPLTGQFGEEVLFINALAPAEHLREVALRRITAVENLLQLMEDDSDSGLIHATARLASALAPLVSEARQLYELALERPGYKAGPTQR
ncbi:MULTISPECIES: hypothetical protein [Pseudomonas]|uniref:hypothetical protein n=1 Tax=Pseudomonas nitroreducens TaxID=46680 RepID=UPI001E440EC3|nr:MULTISPECIES: hypothetical protein [Pseudomonas]MCE4069585.1 hypothetical protein [Pseudomonas nitritireducens]MCE4079252.1 hypothetical protein [Pseudomonas nitroreducens]